MLLTFKCISRLKSKHTIIRSHRFINASSLRVLRKTLHHVEMRETEIKLHRESEWNGVRTRDEVRKKYSKREIHSVTGRAESR